MNPADIYPEKNLSNPHREALISEELMFGRMIPPQLLELLIKEATPHPNCPELLCSRDVINASSSLESSEALDLICSVYDQVAHRLGELLLRRVEDRAFIDERTCQLNQLNQGIPYLDPAYRTILGERDQQGRLILGPYSDEESAWSEVDVPLWLAGDQVTLFGPPDTAKMSINAMNALHHQLPDEPALITQLVEESNIDPRWGADSEDSKTPMIQSLLSANENLKGCFSQQIRFEDTTRGKVYSLREERLARPIKRIPGLALPNGHHLWRGRPIPFHIYDFVLHLFHNCSQPEALCFYVPKLENEEEAEYLKEMIACAEKLIQAHHPEYQIGSVRLFIVFENPRAIFRIREIAQALHPYFVGGSLGWHDFLASTARVFRHDPNYRIPVKADPNIVINHIKESHLILVDALKPIGGISIGGMYGTLYEDQNPASFEVSMVGYIKDVITQLKRGLDGFWVAHPNFVRIGIALVTAWRRFESGDHPDIVDQIVSALVPNEDELKPLLEFIHGDDVPGLVPEDPLYTRGVLAADVEPSDLISNSDEAEVRYNIFQALQYLADWLTGNGCVALPAKLKNVRGEEVFVRVMDDLATTERSRWELWAEVAHGRVSTDEFDRLLDEEANFIRAGIESGSKKIQVRWEGEAAKWYPTAIETLRALVLDPNPPEFVPELILPFTFSLLRDQSDPWSFVQSLRGHQR